MIVGTVKRIVKEADRTYFLLIPVCYSPSENRYHRILPNFLVPYKHYTVETIKQAVNDDQDLDLHDLPSDSSRIRWKKLIDRRSEPKHSDSFSLSCLLHVITFSVTDRSVTLSVIIHGFTPGELAGLLNQPIYKRL